MTDFNEMTRPELVRQMEDELSTLAIELRVGSPASHTRRQIDDLVVVMRQKFVTPPDCMFSMQHTQNWVDHDTHGWKET